MLKRLNRSTLVHSSFDEFKHLTRWSQGCAVEVSDYVALLRSIGKKVASSRDKAHISKVRFYTIH